MLARGCRRDRLEPRDDETPVGPIDLPDRRRATEADVLPLRVRNKRPALPPWRCSRAEFRAWLRCQVAYGSR